MIVFRQLFDPQSSTYTYLLGDAHSRQALLVVAPAGIAEMVLTGKVLGLDSTMIAGFQLMRILIVLVWCRTALVLFRRVAEWTFGPPSDDKRA